MDGSIDKIDITLFVACYNERERIAATLAVIGQACGRVGCSYEVLVIDDASTDGSAETVRAFVAEHPEMPVRLVVNQTNRGLARNFVSAAQLGTGEYYRLICGDDVEPAETLEAILRCMGKADVVLPYPRRPLPGKSLGRRMLSRVYTALVNAAAGYPVRYWNGLTLLRRQDVLRYPPRTQGFGFQAELAAQLLLMGRSWIQVPGDWHERTGGRSTALRLGNFASAAATLARIVRMRVMG